MYPSEVHTRPLSPSQQLFGTLRKNTRQSIATVGMFGSYKACLVHFVILFSARFKITSD